MRRLILAALAAAISLCGTAHAQNNRATINNSTTITLGNTFQQIRPAENRWSITIQNNNATTDNCWVYVGAGSATKANSILLTPGLPWQRYYPYVPNDIIQATCATTGDSLYIDEQ